MTVAVERLARSRMPALRVTPAGTTLPHSSRKCHESFFAPLQANVLNQQRWTTREELRIAIVTWIERTYDRRRRQPPLGRLSPVEFEATMNTPAALAA